MPVMTIALRAATAGRLKEGKAQRAAAKNAMWRSVNVSQGLDLLGF